jgi:hypothetical protein
MRFLYPEVFFAAAFLALPILIHLFNFRKYKKIVFTNVRFLKEITQQTQSRSKLKHLLVLFSRLLMLLFLISAFAQPYIPVGSHEVSTSGKIIDIYVDNSFSMNNSGRNGTLLEEAKRKAREIVSSGKASDRFRLLTNDFEARHQQLMAREQVLEEIDDIKAGPASRKLSEIAGRQAETPSRHAIHYIISDFQVSMTDLSAVKTDTGSGYTLIPLSSQEQSNIYIDSCWLESPVTQLNQPAVVKARIRNTGSRTADNIPVKLYINRQQKGISSVTLPPQGETVTSLSFTLNESGWQNASVSLTDHPVTFDNDYYLSFYVSDKISVLSIGKPNSYISTLFGKDPYFNYTSVAENQVNYSALSEYQLIVLNEVSAISSGLSEELKKYLSKGGAVVLFPSLTADLSSYNSFLASVNAKGYGEVVNQEIKISKIELQSDVYRDVFEKVPENMDLPVVRSYLSSAGPSLTTEESLLKLENGASFLSRYRYGESKLYVFSAPLLREVTSFGEHALFVPTLYKSALLSLRSTLSLYTIGSGPAIEYRGQPVSGETSLHLVRDKFDIIPEHRTAGDKLYLFENGQVKEAGNYSLLLNNVTQALLSFNFSRTESDVRQYSSDELESLKNSAGLKNVTVLETEDKSLARMLSEINEGVRLWKLCVILALVFLAAELLLLKFLK